LRPARLVQLLKVDIEFEEERTGISDPMNSNYSDLARKLRARRDNLIATISGLEGNVHDHLDIRRPEQASR
jgi:hypothetical protein